ncbi:MAG: FAD-binding protein [Cytophagaceae bacterium]|jgi:FAD/FMN-containing dehydrogenase/Fe-S oxidoreductase|nr:FAD-binding protein [Cytophagaceae bacterium]
MLAKLEALKKQLDGALHVDVTMRTLYATDASVYRELPLAVAIPTSEKDIQTLISFANTHKVGIIPRTAGTSLAGQVVGKGIVVDVSKYWNKILEVNIEEKWVRIQPGVVLDELNKYLASYNLFFGPETSTSSRCMLGGMVGNNSCGSHSVIYGTTRDHLLEVKGYLSDGSPVHFHALSETEYLAKQQLPTLEGNIYQYLDRILKDTENQKEIRREFPKPSINRRNTGYAIDVLLESAPFTEGKPAFNMCKLIAGSEGTLCFMTELKLNLVDAPPKEKAVVAVHLNSISEATRANLIALSHRPGAVELLDDIVLQCTKSSIEHSKNRFFVQGDPGALLIVEWARETRAEIEHLAHQMEKDMRAAGYGYHFPILWGNDINKVWAIRKAGLGLLGNIPGDMKGAACIEDTAVDVHDQPAFIDEFQEILKKHQSECVFYAHIGDGELHLRPVMNLKEEKDRQLMFTMTDEVADLVKKYRGSLSGEHGDGRVRAPFVKKMIGEKNYHLICELKKVWDPNDILNPNKIVNAPPMLESLRYDSGQQTNAFKTTFDFSKSQGILRMAEQCNGAGDCRKSSIIGGTMCPSFQATKNEKDTTRARANILREFLTRSTKVNKFDHKEIYEVMDLCLSCKGCTAECPSNVDVSTLKAEFLQQYYDANGVPFRSKLIANFAKANAINSHIPRIANFITENPFTGGLLKRVLGIAPQRPLPTLSPQTLRKWATKNPELLKPKDPSTIKGKVFLFCDEYTNYNEAHIGQKTILLLERLGYEVVLPQHLESARTYLSKGLVRAAQKIAKQNVLLLKDLISDATPLIGIEPSAILSFRDEYPKLVGDELKPAAEQLAKDCLLIDEFISREIDKGNITTEHFTRAHKKVKLHGHCHQKALSSISHSQKMLSLPPNYKVEVIPSGCCGMAGSFGYEKEHYDLSLKIGELVLFPAVRKADAETLLAAPGTSCRHQIKDGTGRVAKHTVEILYEALT